MNQSRLFPYRSSSHALALIVRFFVAFTGVALPLPGSLHPYWGAAGAAPLAAGQTFVVNSPLDTPDADPTDGVCADAHGQCTLRAAIMQANASTGPVTVTVPSGVYLLSRAGSDDTLFVGDLDIRHDLTIQGAGSAATIVDGNGAATGDRVFDILSTAQTVSLSSLTIRNGKATTATVPISLGGGIYRDGNSGGLNPPSLHLVDVIVEGNTAAYGSGGGLFVDHGQVILDRTSIHANAALISGGGLSIECCLLTMRDSHVYSNTVFQRGGGLALFNMDDAHIERTEIYSNTTSYDGGGVFNGTSDSHPLSRVTLLDSYLHHNHAEHNGGAIVNAAQLVISRTVLDANTAGMNGGGLTIQPLVVSTMLINQSTLSRNTAQYGGGIYYNGNFQGQGSMLTLLNSTLSGNSVSYEGGGLYADGVAQISLDNATIADNQLYPPFVPHFAVRGGGLFITGTAVITAQNTIIAHNFFDNGITVRKHDDCFGPLNSLDYNLIESTDNCAISGFTANNVYGQPPLLGPLQNNGGSTQTHALLPGSLTIDAANNQTGCTDAGGAPITIDQRGAPRTDVRCDIGAYEVVPEADLSVAKHGSSNTVLIGAPLTYTIVVTNNGPLTATGVMLTDTLPVSVTLGTAASTQGSCIGTVTVICNLGLLPSGANITVTVAVTPTAAGVITNSVTVTANEFDPVMANNTASATTAVLHKLYLPLIRR